MTKRFSQGSCSYASHILSLIEKAVASSSSTEEHSDILTTPQGTTDTKKKYILLKDEHQTDQTFMFMGVYTDTRHERGRRVPQVDIVMKVHGKRRFERIYLSGMEDIVRSSGFLQQIYHEIGNFLEYFLEKYPEILYINLDIEMKNILGIEPYTNLAHALASRFHGRVKNYFRQGQHELRIYLLRAQLKSHYGHAQSIMP